MSKNNLFLMLLEYTCILIMNHYFILYLDIPIYKYMYLVWKYLNIYTFYIIYIQWRAHRGSENSRHLAPTPVFFVVESNYHIYIYKYKQVTIILLLRQNSRI